MPYGRTKRTLAVLLLLCAFSLVIIFGPKQTDWHQRPEPQIDPDRLTEAPFPGWVEGIPKIQAPEDFDWKQYAGITLNFISENTPPSAALAANIEQFENVTGIKVNIEQYRLPTVAQKVGLDFNAGAGYYDLIYVDPYQILSKYTSHLVDLNRFEQDPTLPHIPGGTEDFIQSQLEVVGYMENRDRLYALPYDAPTMVLAYRKDVIEKYKSLFLKEKGYDWTPDPDLTWENYYEIAQWINRKIAEGVITEVKYGIGHQAKQHPALMCDFSNILASFGGDYFADRQVGSLGSRNPGESLLTSPEAIEAMQFYNRLLQEADPRSASWDWMDVARAFAAGDFALSPQWHEYSSMFEDPNQSEISGKVGWTVLPKGPKRRADIFGGSGIGINRDASAREQAAAWLFLIWTTSPQVQYMILQSEEGGATPTRYSVYDLPDVKKGMEAGTEESQAMPNLLPMKATLEAWKKENLYMRPKMPQWWQVHTVIYTELSQMLRGKQSPLKTAHDMAKKSNAVTGNDDHSS